MLQITYDKESTNLIIAGPVSLLLEDWVKSLEHVKRTPIAGGKAHVECKRSPWNVALLRKFAFPAAITPMAKLAMDSSDAPVNIPGAAVRDETPDIRDWQFYRTPFRHQVISWKFAVDNPNAALFLDMGLGKTFVTVNVLDYFRRVRGAVLPSLVVIPLSSFETWEREFRECQSDAKVVSVTGSRQRKIDLLKSEGDVFLITYESLKFLMDEVAHRKWTYIVLDESTKIKNAQAERSKALYKLRDSAERRMILTGYPITQSYVDVFGQFKFLDPLVYGTSFHYFRNKYCVMGGFDMRQVVGYANIKDLTDRLFSRAIRYTKAECLDLPEKTYQIFKFDLGEHEQPAYDELKRELVLKMEGDDRVVKAQNALVAGLRLVQICTGYVGGVVPKDESAEPVIQELGDDSKLNLLEEILDTIPSDQSMIIWCRFRKNLEQIQALLARRRISSIAFHGDLSAKERKEAIEAFQAGTARAFVGILNAGGHGLNLTRASYVVYFSQDHSIERRMQSEDRAHRIGQTRNVTYVDLVARGTVEESILRCLRGKKRESEVVFEFAKNPQAFLEGRDASV